jgi:hypothetical protein
MKDSSRNKRGKRSLPVSPRNTGSDLRAKTEFGGWTGYYLGVNFSNLLVGGVSGDTVPVPLSVNT